MLVSKLSDSRGVETVRLQSSFVFGCLVISSPVSENQIISIVKNRNVSWHVRTKCGNPEV